MNKISNLNEAFQNFTFASRSLETYYEKLQEQVRHLTGELADSNRQLKAALNETEEAKDYLKGILQGLAEAIIVLDPDKNITMLNKASRKLLGLDSEDVAGRPFDSLDFSIDKEGADTFLHVKGIRYNVILSCSEVLDGDGRERGQVVLIQDVTRTRELESQYDRNRRLIAMGEMAAKIVHEIRSPLCSIELYASMLARELEETKHIGLAKGISTGIKSLNNILTNMLFFAKPNKPTSQPVALSMVLGETVSILRPMLDVRRILLTQKILHSSVIAGDSELIKQVFLNVIINAVQVTQDGGKIDVTVKSEGGYVVAEVTDEGGGIQQEDRKKIFDPFFTTKDKGTGLGLTIASKIMQSHGGAIRVSSQVGMGSSFQLCFPGAEDEMAVAEASRGGVI